jgi:hypothetical protein
MAPRFRAMVFWTDPSIMFFSGSFGFAWSRGAIGKMAKRTQVKKPNDFRSLRWRYQSS